MRQPFGDVNFTTCGPLEEMEFFARGPEGLQIRFDFVVEKELLGGLDGRFAILLQALAIGPSHQPNAAQDHRHDGENHHRREAGLFGLVTMQMVFASRLDLDERRHLQVDVLGMVIPPLQNFQRAIRKGRPEIWRARNSVTHPCLPRRAIRES